MLLAVCDASSVDNKGSTEELRELSRKINFAARSSRLPFYT
jgi:hypothetical protein